MKKKAEKKKMLLRSTRRNVIVIALIAVLVLVINLITASYSWFTPQEDKKTGMSYSFSGLARSENCTMTTYKGKRLASANGDERGDGQYWGQLVYESSPAASTSVAAGKTQYFKTEIINGDANNASDISLYISSLPACTLAVTYPGNSVRTFAGQQTDLYIVRDAFVKRKDTADVNGPGKLEIEWFVTNNGSSSITVNPNNLYLLYN